MSYLKNAPKALIKLYEKRLRTDGSLINGSFVPLIKHRPRRKSQAPQGQLALLDELLFNSRMKPAWKIIGKSVKTSDGYEKLLKAIIESMRLARRGFVAQKDRRGKFEDIAIRAEKLAKLIAEPQRLPLDGSPPLYRGELDLQTYELLPDHVANNLGAESYPKMKSGQRSDWAYSLLGEWPTMVELLEQLAIRARLLGNEYIFSGRRSRGPQEEKVIATKARLFACCLYDYMHKLDKKFNGFAAITVIVSLDYDVNADRKTVRKWISDHRKKTTT